VAVKVLLSSGTQQAMSLSSPQLRELRKVQ